MEVYGLPSGRVIARLPGSELPRRRDRETTMRLSTRCCTGAGEPPPRCPSRCAAWCPSGDGCRAGACPSFRTSRGSLSVPGGLAWPEDGRLRYQTPDGQYDYPDAVPDGDGGFIENTLPGRGFTADPMSGRLAFLAHPSRDWSSRVHIVLLDRDGQLIGLSRNLQVEPPEHLQWLGFAGPDLLITYGLGRFRAWPIGGGERISPAAEATGFTVRGYPQIPELAPDMLSLAGPIVVGDRCLDAVTLSEVDMPGWLADLPRWTWLFFAPGGTHVAALTDWHFNGDEYPGPRANGKLRVRSLWQRQLGDLLTRPLASTGAADVTRLAPTHALLAHSDVRGVLALLRACVAYRLAHDSTGASERP